MFGVVIHSFNSQARTLPLDSFKNPHNEHFNIIPFWFPPVTSALAPHEGHHIFKRPKANKQPCTAPRMPITANRIYTRLKIIESCRQ